MLVFLTMVFWVGMSQFNEGLSRMTARYAATAFCSPECVQSWTCKTTQTVPKLTMITYLDSSLTKAVGYVGFDPMSNQVVIGWRGSSNIQNWIEDFNFETEAYHWCSGCQVHAGFMFDFRSLQKQLLSQIDSIMLQYSVKSFLFTGHSLGAALATISGIQLYHHYGEAYSYTIHNYGQPRVGNKQLSFHIKQHITELYRVVHNKDIVPHLPPQFSDYHHPPTEVFYNEDFTFYKLCDTSGQDPKCSNQYFPMYNTDDHDFYFIQMNEISC